MTVSLLVMVAFLRYTFICHDGLYDAKIAAICPSRAFTVIVVA